MELHGFINVDKPLGWTSHDVVGKLRRILSTRKIGHAGTLDPAATGVLVAGVGRATRFLDYVQSSSKEYLAHVVLGTESESADIDGRMVDHLQDSIFPPELRDIESALRPFIGQIEQVPPKFSAIKIDGEPIYRKARRGESVDVPTRTVTVHELSVVSYRFPDLILAVTCGSGFYVRSLARDVGESLGIPSYLHHLVRTRVGDYTLQSSTCIQELESMTFPEMWTFASSGIEAGIAQHRAAFLHGDHQTAWYHGRSIHGPGIVQNGPELVRGIGSNGVFLGLGSQSSVSESESDIQPAIVIPERQ
ncbi:MAG: tRNA pseudouridine(55) synthase TruB [Sphaerobacteraceae bacterium]|nr:MAG: tRNA pseudouridine(55) synthase TruB [Sphaerobacteraceae bacterium]